MMAMTTVGLVLSQALDGKYALPQGVVHLVGVHDGYDHCGVGSVCEVAQITLLIGFFQAYKIKALYGKNLLDKGFLVLRGYLCRRTVNGERSHVGRQKLAFRIENLTP